MDADKSAILNFLEGEEKRHKEVVKVIADERDRNERTIQKKLEQLEESNKVKRKESGRKVYFQVKEDQSDFKRSGRRSDSGIATEENIDHLRQINYVTEKIISEYHLDPDGIFEGVRSLFDNPDSEEVYIESDSALKSLETLNQISIDTSNSSAPQDAKYRNLIFSMLDNILLLIQGYNKINSEAVSDNARKIVRQGLAVTWDVAIDSEDGSEYADMFTKKRDRMMDILTTEDTPVFANLIYLIIETSRLSGNTESGVENAKAVAEYVKQVDSWDRSEAYRMVSLLTSEERRNHLFDALEEGSYTETRQEKVNEIIDKFENGGSSFGSDDEINAKHWKALNRTDQKTLAVLSHGTNATSKIRELTGMPKPTISKSVKRLEKKGWVKDGPGHGVYKLTGQANEYYQDEDPEAKKEDVDRMIDIAGWHLNGEVRNVHAASVRGEPIQMSDFTLMAIDYSFLLDDEDTRTRFFDVIREATENKSFNSYALQENRKHTQYWLFRTARKLHKNWMRGTETMEYRREVNDLKEELCEYHGHAPALVRSSVRGLIGCVDIEKARELFEEAIKADEEPESHLRFSMNDLYDDRHDLDKLMALKESLEEEGHETKLIKSYFPHRRSGNDNSIDPQNASG